MIHDAPWLAGDKTDESREAEAPTAEDSEGENSPDELPAKQRKAFGLGMSANKKTTAITSPPCHSFLWCIRR